MRRREPGRAASREARRPRQDSPGHIGDAPAVLGQSLLRVLWHAPDGSYGLFPWVALLRFAFGQKIWHTIFLSSKANFKIFPKLLPKPRRASPSLKNSLAMVLPRYPAWNTSPCLLAKSPSL